MERLQKEHCIKIAFCIFVSVFRSQKSSHVILQYFMWIQTAVAHSHYIQKGLSAQQPDVWFPDFRNIYVMDFPELLHLFCSDGRSVQKIDFNLPALWVDWVRKSPVIWNIFFPYYGIVFFNIIMTCNFYGFLLDSKVVKCMECRTIELWIWYDKGFIVSHSFMIQS